MKKDEDEDEETPVITNQPISNNATQERPPPNYEEAIKSETSPLKGMVISDGRTLARDT